ncbi:hypothetical protein V6N12_024373 [Hibiscus sabdariffa]|uniref:Endonuclease/exonuclease/phosphatase domain-containing protein n=1 Tax=Hibiscus sabdariffa TaxID=183260 RepID=A0ABR2G0J2_9ROSI
MWFVNVYDPSVDSEKSLFFEELLSLLGAVDVPCCIGGDFNAFLDLEQKIGGAVNFTIIEMFRKFIQEAELIDLPMLRGAYSWCNNLETPTFVHLDRFLVSPDFLSTFPDILQVLLMKSISDHNAVMLREDKLNWGSKPFKYFNV